MFRHERPQKGRYRQFTQIGVEFMGDNSILDDIDLILMSKTFFDKINLYDLDLIINTLAHQMTEINILKSLLNILRSIMIHLQISRN